ncbi:MAG: hypothetical protein IPI62_14920 [Bacteroidetes bacterium]|nr:hypothetical protein [Bacteroidota bacterium]
MSFGIYKSGTATTSDLLILECSSDGVNYLPLSYSLPTGLGTNAWFYRTAIGTIPSTANLRIRFRQAAAIPSNQYRIDDIQLTADDPGVTITASLPAYICNGNSVTLSAPTELSYLWSNSSTVQNLSVTIAGTYNCILTSFNGCTITSNSITINDSIPTQYIVTGGGNYCSSPGTGVSIGLSSSQTEYNYQLYQGLTPIGSPLPGNGTPLSLDCIL